MINVTCAIIVRDKLILVAQRGEKMKLPLKWEFPGGKIEENETAEECILREVKEELNLEIAIQARLSSSSHDYGAFIINLIPFVAQYKSGVIELTEHNDYKWVDVRELSYLDWAPADIPILNEFLKNYNDGTRTL